MDHALDRDFLSHGVDWIYYPKYVCAFSHHEIPFYEGFFYYAVFLASTSRKKSPSLV